MWPRLDPEEEPEGNLGSEKAALGSSHWWVAHSMTGEERGPAWGVVRAHMCSAAWHLALPEAVMGCGEASCLLFRILLLPPDTWSTILTGFLNWAAQCTNNLSDYVLDSPEDGLWERPSRRWPMRAAFYKRRIETPSWRTIDASAD